MKTQRFKALYLLLLVFTGNSQVEFTRLLDANNVSALIGDEGTFFQNNTLYVAHYEIPKGSGKNVIYHMTPWLGMRDVNNQIQVCASTHVTNHLRSGPVAYQSAYPTMTYSNLYNEAIWSLTQDDIEYHLQHFQDAGYSPISAISSWPGNGQTSMGIANQLAPYVDVNNNDTYEPLLGDYPKILGDQAIYIILHDYPTNGQSTPMNIELHVMAYQFTSGGYLNNTSFLNVKVYNRSTMNYHDFRQAMYLDVDVGNYLDDYIGCDTLRNLAYGYNGDQFDEDEGGRPGYQNYPPCVGIMSLNRKMDYFGYYDNGSIFPYTDPVNATEFWYFMNGQYANGDQWQHNGLPINYFYPGLPTDPTQWSEGTSGNPPNDRRFVMTVREQNFPIGSMICTDYAILFDNSNDHSLQNVQNTLYIADALQALYNSTPDFPCTEASLNIEKPITDPELRIFPNPTTGKLYIEFKNQEEVIEIGLSDMSGRHLWSMQEDQKGELKIDLNEVPGNYILQIKTSNGVHSERIIID